MYKFWISIKKEYWQLINDKVGLSLMFFLPLFLVLVITIVQDSAYKIITENKVSILIVNKDGGSQSEKLVELLKESGMFNVSVDNEIDTSEIKKALLDKNMLTAILIPNNFSDQLKINAQNISETMMIDLGLKEQDTSKVNTATSLHLNFYHDPILQDNYSISLINMLYSLLYTIENSLMIETVYSELGIENKNNNLKEKESANKIYINKIAATNQGFNAIPNSTQHNVPAWTIFAMFFMVISLGGNIVRERLNGSFIRLKTMPTSFSIVLLSKMFMFLVVAFLQVALIFSVGIFIFPFINLPELVLPSQFLQFLIVVLISALAAVSYALMIGTVAKTQEQSNGIGAVSIIIFAAIGGIWVPTFVMPDYIQLLSNLSPLQWCLKGFYILFLKGGNWSDLFTIILPLFGFIFGNFIITYYKLKVDKII